METDQSIRLRTGLLMARYYLAFGTVILFEEVARASDLHDLIQVISRAKEFDDIILRNNEKKRLNELNEYGKKGGKGKKDEAGSSTEGSASTTVATATGLRFPIKGRIKTKEQKIECLLQATLGHKTIEDFGLRMEATQVMGQATRIARCMAEYLISCRKYVEPGVRCHLLSRCLQQEMWEEGPFLLQQLDGIGESMGRLLSDAGISTFAALEKTDSRRIESIVRRNPPFGTNVKASFLSIAQYDLQLVQRSESDRSSVDIILRRKDFNQHVLLEPPPAKGKKRSRAQYCMLLVGDGDGTIVLEKQFRGEFPLNTCDTLGFMS